MPSITARLQGLSLDSDEPAPAAATTSQVDDAQPECRRWYRRTRHDFTPVNSRPFPTLEECQAARAKKKCMFYGFYAGELAIQQMMIDTFPKHLGHRDAYEPGLLLPGINFVRDITGRRDIGLHIAYVSRRNKDAIPSTGLEVGEVTFIVGLFPLEREAYLNRLTQGDVDMLEELFGTKPSWWEIAQLCDV